MWQFSDVAVMSYVSCIFDGQWWIGIVSEISLTKWDIYVNFLHPTGPSTTFYWLACQDKCWVSLAHILSYVPQPNIAELLGICAVNIKGCCSCGLNLGQVVPRP